MLGTTILAAVLSAALPMQGTIGGGQSPGRWAISSHYIEGENSSLSWYMHEGAPQSLELRYDWGTDESPMFLHAVNSTPSRQTIWFRSRGTIRYELTWVGMEFAPSRVLVSIASGAGYTADTLDGHASASNGLGHPAVVENVGHLDGRSVGRNLRYLDVVNGRASVEVSSAAEIHATGSDGLTASAYAGAGHIEIVEKAVSIVAAFEPTYIIGYKDASVPKKHDDLANKEVWTSLSSVFADGSAVWHDTFYAGLHGQWTQPWTELDFSWTPRYDPPFYLPWEHDEMHRFSEEEVNNMITGRPATFLVPLTVRDRWDGISADAMMTVLVYAPRAFPVSTEKGRMIGAFLPASQWVRVNAWQQEPIVLKMTHSYVDSVTRTFGFGVQADLAPGFLKKFIQLLRPNVSWQHGQTASISSTISVDVPLPLIPGETWEYQIVRAKVYHLDRGFTHRYDRHGFRGLDNFELIDFYSPTKAAAEKYDYLDDLKRRQVE
jgi:hypothetical protein